MNADSSREPPAPLRLGFYSCTHSSGSLTAGAWVPTALSSGQVRNNPIRQFLSDADVSRRPEKAPHLVWEHVAVVIKYRVSLHPGVQFQPRLNFIPTNIVLCIETRRYIEARLTRGRSSET